MRARTARLEETVREKAALLETAYGKEAKANQRAFASWGNLVAAC
jgi:hypothetical protein